MTTPAENRNSMQADEEASAQLSNADVGVCLAEGASNSERSLAATQRNIAIVSNLPAVPRSSTRGAFWDLLFAQLEEHVQANSETVEFHWANADEAGPVLSQTLLEKISSGQIHGLIGIALSDEQVERVWQQLPAGVPMVGFAQHPPYIVWYSLNELVRMAVPLLAKRGCRNISFWRVLFTAGQKAKNELDLSLRDEFIQALSKAGLPFNPSLYSVQHLLENRAGLSAHQMGYRIALEYFGGEQEVRPDGIIIADDTVTVGALAALRHLGLEPGRDVHIVSHANAGSPLLFGTEKELMLLEFDTADLVRELFDLLNRVIAGEKVADMISIPPRLREGIV